MSSSLERALAIIDVEIEKLEALSEGEATLDRQDSSILNDYVKTLLSMRKDERDVAKGDNLQNVSEDELLTLVGQASEYLKAEK